MKPIIGATIAVVVIGGSVMAYVKHSGNNTPQTQYKLATVQLGEVNKTVSATGTLEPWSTVDIKSKAGGRVNELRVEVGSKVKKGEVIANIDQSDTLLTVQTAQADIEQAKAKTTQAQYSYQLQLKEAQTTIANAKAALNAAIANRESKAATQEQARLTAASQPAITEASIKQAEANYNEAVTTLATLKITDKQDLAAAKSTYDQAKANLANAKISYERQKSLAAQGFVAEQTVDSNKATYDVDQAAFESAKEKLSTIEAEQNSNIEENKAKVDAALHALKSAQASGSDVPSKKAAYAAAKADFRQAVQQVAEAQATYNESLAKVISNDVDKQDIAINQATIDANKASLINANETLKQTVVTAPSDGVVIEKDVSQGTIITSGTSSVSTGTTIVTIGEVSRMYVNAAVDETDLSGVQEGQKVNCEFDAYPGRVFNGVVSRIDPQSTITNNVTQFDVRVEIDNKSPDFKLLRPGMNSTCTFISANKENVLSVESDAINTDDQGQSYVTIATGGKVAPEDPTTNMPVDPTVFVGIKTERRTVQTGLVGDDNTEITGGLQAGEKIVVSTVASSSQTDAASSQSGSSPFGGRPTPPKERKK